MSRKRKITLKTKTIPFYVEITKLFSLTFNKIFVKILIELIRRSIEVVITALTRNTVSNCYLKSP